MCLCHLLLKTKEKDLKTKLSFRADLMPMSQCHLTTQVSRRFVLETQISVTYSDMCFTRPRNYTREGELEAAARATNGHSYPMNLQFPELWGCRREPWVCRQGWSGCPFGQVGKCRCTTEGRMQMLTFLRQQLGCCSPPFFFLFFSPKCCTSSHAAMLEREWC